MEKRINRLRNKSFEKMILDQPVPNVKVKFSLRGNKSKLETTKLPEPLKPTKPKPIPKPRVKSKRPVPLPRLKPVPLPRRRPVPLQRRGSLPRRKPSSRPRPKAPKPIDMKVKGLIDEITPYYKPEAIEEFSKILKGEKSPRMNIVKRRQALRNRVKSFEVAIVGRKDPRKQLYYTTPGVAKELEDILNRDGGMKAQVTLHVTFKKKKIRYGTDGQAEEVFEYKDAYFNSNAFTILNEYQIIDALDKAAEEINNKIAVWLSEGSGWTIVEIRSHFVNIVKYLPLRGNSYIPSPKELRHHNKGLINLKNTDNKCLLWCLVRHLNPRNKNPQRITKSDRKFAKKLDFSGITFSVTLLGIKRIEKQNKININVFGYDTEKKSVFPIEISKESYDDHLEVLYIEGKNELGEETTHYVYIKDFNRLMYNFTKHKGKKHFCMHCLQCFYSNESLAKHRVNCIAINGVQAIKMPEKYTDKNGVERSPCVYFKNHHKSLPVPFSIYADFECTTEKVSGCQPSDSRSYTQQYQKHTACSFGYKVVCHYDEMYSGDVVIYRGEDCIEKFMKCMFEEVKNCQKIIRDNFNKPLIMTEEDDEAFTKATHCHICEKRYKVDDVPVRDHCHVTGKYRGSAHQTCNLKLQISAEKIKIPVIFHNLKGYDSHFIINELGELIKKGEEGISIKVIAQNAEKYMAFYINNHLSFIDSFQFMNSSLEKLAGNLSEDDFIYTKKYFTDPVQFGLVKRKGVYPCDYMDSFSKVNDTELPQREDFYSLLTGENISEDAYSHAKSFWNTLNLKNMGEYHDLYLKTDILLLTDVFENFRKTCLTYYKLDPLHYITSPGLAWDAMLKMTKINLELITDIDMQLFIERGMRGGISYIAHRHAEANNKYMNNYDPDKPSSYIMYLDANNLYGWAMSQPLPYRNFKWLYPDTVFYVGKRKVDDTIIEKKKGIGHIYEVDLEYPEELHDLHNDYPCAPEKIKVSDDMLSDYCREIKNKFTISSGNVSKLIPNLNDKKNYVIHEELLKLYLNLGLKLKKVHRVLEFDEKPWLKPYIDFNTDKRTNAKNAFEKEFFKMMNNSVYGKTMENVRKRSNIYLETDPDHLLRQVAKPTYVSHKIFHENLVAVHMKKNFLKLDKPSYVGMCILDLSKVLMYDFHYNFIKAKYGDRAKLLFTDTDSLSYHIQTDDVYEDLYKHKEMFDNSDYSKSSKFYFDENKKVIGKFKDEAAGNLITSFVGLKSKMYSYLVELPDGEIKNNKTAKGISKNVTKRDLEHEDYLSCLLNSTIEKHMIKTIRSDHHVVSSYEINKISLSCFDDKRYILDDGITSYAYGNYKAKL